MTDGATCSICQGISDQESILTCRGCSLIAHLECYFTKGSRDANDTITGMEQWCCETCGGFARHTHPRPVEAKRQRVTWTQSLAHSGTSLIGPLQDLLSLQQKPMGSSQPEMLPSRGLTSDNDQSLDVNAQVLN